MSSPRAEPDENQLAQGDQSQLISGNGARSPASFEVQNERSLDSVDQIMLLKDFVTTSIEKMSDMVRRLEFIVEDNKRDMREDIRELRKEEDQSRLQLEHKVNCINHDMLGLSESVSGIADMIGFNVQTKRPFERQQVVNSSSMLNGVEQSASSVNNVGRNENGNNGYFTDSRTRNDYVCSSINHHDSSGVEREDFQTKVRPYNSKESDWFSYREYFESIANLARWSDRTKCVRLMGALGGNLAGIATGLGGNVTYHGLLSRLDSIHGIANDRLDAVTKLDVCKNL